LVDFQNILPSCSIKILLLEQDQNTKTLMNRLSDKIEYLEKTILNLC